MKYMYAGMCVCVWMCVGARTRVAFVYKLMCLHVHAAVCLWVWACVSEVTEKTKGIKTIVVVQTAQISANRILRLCICLTTEQNISVNVLYFTSVCECVYCEIPSVQHKNVMVL